MVSLAISWISYNFLLPITLIASVIFRYNIFSSIYLVLLLISPYAPSLSHASKGRCGSYVFGILLTSLLFILAQISFQAALLANPPYGSLAGEQCSYKEKILRYIGFERLDLRSVADTCRYLLPDVLTFIVSTITFVLIKKITPPHEQQQQQQALQSSGDENGSQNQPDDVLSQESELTRKFLTVTSTAVKNGAMVFVSLIAMALAGITNPSLFSATYLLIFMILMTLWSFHGRMLSNRVAAIRVVVSFIAAVQLVLLYYYQIEFFRDAYPQTKLGARLMGLTPFVNTTCATNAYKLVLNSGITWTEFVCPPLTFIMYLILALGVRMYFASDKTKMPSRSRSTWRRRTRKKDERMVRSLVIKVESDEVNLQPLVREEVAPHTYETMPTTSRSSAAEGVTTGQADSAQLTKPGILHKLTDWMSGLKMQSFYVAALVVMMAWSVTFHSWLTLVLLVWSCILWLVENRSWATLCCSPAITIYAMLLICLQYIYSLNLTEEELPTVAKHSDNSSLNLSSFGIKHYYNSDPSLSLGGQILYTCVFWIVLHQFMYIKRHRSDTRAKDETSWVVQASLYLKEKLSKYWILVVYGFLLALCTEGRPSGIKMIYAFLFIFSGFIFEISWVLWHRMLSIFLMTLVIYTMLVVLLIYTFQFDDVPNFWQNFTNFTKEELEDLGLIKYDETGLLLLRIFIPTLFLLVVIFQKHYFHARFLELIKLRVKVVKDNSGDDEQPEVASDRDGSQESIEMQDLSRRDKPTESRKGRAFKCMKQGWESFLYYWYGLIRLVWRLLEFHMWKVLIITVLVAALQKATLIYALLFVIWVVLIPVRSCRLLLYIVTSVYVGLAILCSMFYQLRFIDELRGDDLYYNCSFELDANTSWLGQYDLLEDWIGLSKMDGQVSFFYHSQGLITIIIMLAFERIAIRRQDWRRYYRREMKFSWQMTALYPSITHKEVDNDFISCCKYFINYWFYKFGVEACYVMAVITIWVRADSFAVIYSIFLIIAMAIRTRKNLARYWRIYVSILLVMLIGEYAIALGMPPSWCEVNEYPWTTLKHTTTEIRDRLIRWLYLPDFIIPPYSQSLVVDVFQLLFAVSQMYVFEFETTATALARGGDNKYLTPQKLDEVTPAANLRPNFKTKKSRNVLDQFKVALFQYSFWVTAAIVFIAGTTRISLFCMGYLFAFFYLLSFHQQLMMGKPSKLLKVINIVLGYNVGVIVLKIALQITSCVYIDVLEEKACVFVQLLSLVCARPTDYAGLVDRTEQDTCSTPDFYTNAGLTWDFVCFLFLIIQRRIFQTYYFLHVSEDMRISMKLASRGAELFEEKLILEVNNRIASEEKGVAQIHENMASIQKKYANLGKDPSKPMSHTEVMRSGDYYMFEDDEEDKEDEEKEKDILNPIQLIHTADTVGIDEALKEREEDKRLLDEGDDKLPVAKETLTGLSTEDLTETDGEQEEKKTNIIVKGAKFTWELFLSGVDTLILWLNTVNCDYRNIALRLSEEKDELSESHLAESPREISTEIQIEEGEREQPHTDAEEEIQENREVPGPSTSTSPMCDVKPMDFDKDQMRIFRLFYAVWYSIIAHTDVVCYFLIILNLMLSASVMALVLPLAIFLWSTLSTPRPTSRFWNFCIIYLEVVILIKFLFQFEFFPWNNDSQANLQVNNPFWWPRIIGIEQKQSWGVLDLAQLLAIFFHRLTLKVHGLWNKADKSKDEESSEETPKNKSATKESPSADDTPSIKGENADGSGDEEGQKKATKAQRLKKAATSPYRFYSRILHQEFTAVTDVYIFIFLCDVINFIIIIFGYWAFGKYATGATDVVSNISSNRVPTGFLVMLIIQFSMMFIDRALYLRKNLLGKLIFQICLVIGIHVWMFFILPSINERPFYMNHVAQTWYFFKAIYFLLSAYQIRCGYPKKVLGNFLTKAYGTANLFLYKGYRAIPFLVELTAVMDWMFVETTMGVGEWFKFQSIYAEVFELKCWRVFEKNYPSPRGNAKSKLIKYFVGGLLVFFLIAIIWFPLLFMNIAMTVAGVTNNPEQASIQITASSFEPLFQVVADSDSIEVWTEAKFNEFAKEHADDVTAAVFLSTFSPSQVVSIKIGGESKTSWAISPPQRQKLLNRLSNTSSTPVKFEFEWNLIRDSEKTSVVTTYGFSILQLPQFDKGRAQLYDLLKTPGLSSSPALIPELFPKYIYSGAKSTSTAATKLYSTNSSSKFVDTYFSLRYAPNDNMTSWWRVYESNNSSSEASIEIVVFSDQVAPASLSFLASYGIIGLYVSVVLVVGRLVRSMLIGSTSTIMFQELPRVDRVLQLCMDVYLVREEQQFKLEEDLYAKLIFLYRSPQTLIKWTRPKQD